jgi:hypothetical protein
MSDIEVNHQGSLVGFLPKTRVGQLWIEENVQDEPWQWMGRTLWVEHRCAGALVGGMVEDGLSLVAS